MGLLILCIVLAFGLAVLARLMARLAAGPERLPYYSKVHLVSRGEHAFYKALRQAIPPHLIICPKVRLSDLLGCTGAGWKEGYGSRITQKHVDFTLANVDTMAIVLVIELDDRTHLQADRSERDSFVDRALATAGIAILRVKAAANYDPRALRRDIDALIGGQQPVGPPR